MAQNPSRGYASSARVSNEPGAYYEILSSDFGQLSNGAVLVLAYNAGAGSLAMGTARAAVTFITTEGETQIGVDTATVAIAAGSGAFTITKPATPTAGGATILGYRVYSSAGAAGTELLNVAANSTTQVQVPFVTAHGILFGFPLTTASVQVLIYGAGQAVPSTDQSGIQDTLPLVLPNSTVDYYFRVPNSGNRWRIQKSVEWMRPQGIAEPGGVLVGPMDVLNPLYPGTGQPVTASQSLPVYFAMNGYLFKAVTTGTTAAPFIGFSAFNTTQFGTTTDGTVTWMCFGHQILVRCHFGNNTTTPVAGLQPAAQEYDLFLA
jgi:hypothetical protein